MRQWRLNSFLVGIMIGMIMGFTTSRSHEYFLSMTSNDIMSNGNGNSNGNGGNNMVFNEDLIADPQKVMQTMNNLCRLIADHATKPQGRQIAIGTVLFCYTHTMEFRRAQDYSRDNLNAAIAAKKRGHYYSGGNTPPYQMGMLQYFQILTTVASIPARSVKSALERFPGYVDTPSNYRARDDVKADADDGLHGEGPNVLFWGCGADTPMHAHLIEFLGGKITFLDDSQDYLEGCKRSYRFHRSGGEEEAVDVRLIKPNGTTAIHKPMILSLVPRDGSGLETDEVQDPLTASQWIHGGIADLQREQDPWDVIVVDGPAEKLGRSQSLYLAKRLAQSYGPNHYTHVFFHDAARAANVVLANAIMGHDPKYYLGNTLPRKGLKHWRIPGRNRTLPPTFD
mmetsp:Transcript_29738/g.62563  ORF Transcript_29738/g.62563 Transcript_29738/m.62563 type:complete len:396 (-) Transcript_29738:130-1317(-)